jgi:drug/metabolite transporter (DMT)-like permease
METAVAALVQAQTLYVRSGDSSTGSDSRPPIYKAVGISLAVSSGIFIGSSFVLKKTGLLKANIKYNEEAGEGYGYLKNFWWWLGMTLMIVGEVCNLIAYAFVDAILVTPMGALSVVVTTILSAIFLKERLSFVGKVGCFNCIVGSIVIAMNAPQQSAVSTIQDMEHYVKAPGFLSFAGVIIVLCTFIALWAGPRYGKKSMFVYLGICSLIGGLSVVATQGLGAAVLAQINGVSQFKEWFLYVLLVFVVITLLTEIIYLNKALNLYNAALVTPTYYVFFTSSTIVTSAILFQGFKGTAIAIATIIMGFLQICSGVILLQLSKSAKDVPDAAIFKGDLDQIREVSEQEQPETEPKADAIRGAAAIIRRLSVSRQKMEQEEAKRYFKERQEDQLKPPADNEIIEWDGLRRRKTIIGDGTPHAPRSTRSLRSPHPPLGMSHFPEEHEEEARRAPNSSRGGSSILHPSRWRAHGQEEHDHTPMHQVALTDIPMHESSDVDTAYHGTGAQLEPPFQPGSGRERSDTPRSVAWADKPPSDHSSSPRSSHLGIDHTTSHRARRQFSFQSALNRRKTGESPKESSGPNRGILRLRTPSNEQRQAMKNATEEERLNLTRGDSRTPDDGDILDEKLTQSSSDSPVESSPEPPDRPYLRPYQASTTSSVATTAFPPYEDDHPPPPNHDLDWLRLHYDSQITTQNPSHPQLHLHHPAAAPVPPPHRRRSRPSVSGRAHTLPVIPAEELLASDGQPDQYVRVDPSQSSPDLDVTSLSSSPPSSTADQGRRGRRESGWRRDPRPDRGSRSSSRSDGSDSEEEADRRRLMHSQGAGGQGRGRGRAFQ